MCDWIRAKERKPDTSRNVIIFSKAEGIDYGGWYGFYEPDGRMHWFTSDGRFVPTRVTHWMELIKPPVKTPARKGEPNGRAPVCRRKLIDARSLQRDY